MADNNTLQYPEEFWTVKKKDRMVRNTMYPSSLWKEPYFGLRNVSGHTRDPVFKVPEGMVVAGGYAMYLARWVDNYSDIDLFVLDREKAEAFLKSVRGMVYRTTNCISFYLHQIPDHKLHSCPEDVNPKIQVILRLYKAPTEIVHGFDLDCCGILWDGSRLLATDRAIYAHEHHENWFDPERASPSYAYRLSKYSLRGYKIMLPMFQEDMVDMSKYQALYDEIKDMYLTALEDKDAFDIDDVIFKGDMTPGLCLAKHIFSKTRLARDPINVDDVIDIVGRIISHRGHHDPDSDKDIGLGMMVRVLHSCSWRTSFEVRCLIPMDPVSILILAKMFSFHTGLWKRRDYDCRTGTDQEMMFAMEAIPHIQWIEQNPMAQVSSTFYPTPIQDLQAWYKTSPLMHGYTPSPPEERVHIHFHNYHNT